MNTRNPRLILYHRKKQYPSNYPSTSCGKSEKKHMKKETWENLKNLWKKKHAQERIRNLKGKRLEEALSNARDIDHLETE